MGPGSGLAQIPESEGARGAPSGVMRPAWARKSVCVRTMRSATGGGAAGLKPFLEERSRLRHNEADGAIGRPWRRKFGSCNVDRGGDSRPRGRKEHRVSEDRIREVIQRSRSQGQRDPRPWARGHPRSKPSPLQGANDFGRVAADTVFDRGSRHKAITLIETSSRVLFTDREHDGRIAPAPSLDHIMEKPPANPLPCVAGKHRDAHFRRLEIDELRKLRFRADEEAQPDAAQETSSRVLGQKRQVPLPPAPLSHIAPEGRIRGHIAQPLTRLFVQMGGVEEEVEAGATAPLDPRMWRSRGGYGSLRLGRPRPRSRSRHREAPRRPSHS